MKICVRLAIVGTGAAVLFSCVSVVLAANPTVTLTTATPDHGTRVSVVATFSEPVIAAQGSVVISPSGIGSIENFSPTDGLATTTYSFDIVDSGDDDISVSISPDVASSSNNLAYSFSGKRPHASLSENQDTSKNLPSFIKGTVTVYAVFDTPYPISDFTSSSVVVSNATISNIATTSLTSNTEKLSFTLTPTTDGTVTLVIPQNTVHFAPTGLGNTKSNTLSTIADLVSPTLTGTASDITKEAVNPSGNVVSYIAPTAADPTHSLA